MLLPKESELVVSRYQDKKKGGEIEYINQFRVILPNESEFIYLQKESAKSLKDIQNIENFTKLQLGEGAFIQTKGHTEAYGIPTGLNGEYADVIQDIEDSYGATHADAVDETLKSAMKNLSTNTKGSEPHVIYTVKNGLDDLSSDNIQNKEINISKYQVGKLASNIVLNNDEGKFVVAVDSEGRMSPSKDTELRSDQTLLAKIDMEDAKQYKPKGGETHRSRTLATNSSSNDSKMFNILAVGSLMQDENSATTFVENKELNHHILRPMATLRDAYKYTPEDINQNPNSTIYEIASNPNSRVVSDYLHVDNCHLEPTAADMIKTLSNMQKFNNNTQITVVLTPDNAHLQTTLAEALTEANNHKTHKFHSLVVADDSWDNALDSQMIGESFNQQRQSFIDSVVSKPRQEKAMQLEAQEKKPIFRPTPF